MQQNSSECRFFSEHSVDESMIPYYGKHYAK